jgi:signal transduction histidine kinase
VDNLVANALRHSGSSDVEVSVSSSPREFVIAVEDHGVGIPPEHAERVFERFHRVDPARAAESGGAGLGLAIVRRIARMHGGDVSLSAVSPHGCRFAISIPRR